MIKVLTIIGTRPEAIKLAPVLENLKRYPELFNSIVGVTGQQDDLLKQALNIFDIRPDFNLKVMTKNQSLSKLTSRLLTKLDKKLRKIKPDLVIIQGDTTTAFAAALASFYHKIKIAHVEAGLRTDDKYEPFPEEMNRFFIDQISDYLFAPTKTNQRNLLRYGILSERIYVTGNTVIDALKMICLANKCPNNQYLRGKKQKMILLTTHRRENFGEQMAKVFTAIRELAQKYPNFTFVYPVHPNPNVSLLAYDLLSGLKNVDLIKAVDYVSFIRLMKKSYFILTDSGGVQEEAPVFNKPVLILRNKTERTEIVEAGGAKLVGTDPLRIIQEVSRLIENDQYYQQMAHIVNPYGNGSAAQKIVAILKKDFVGSQYELE